MSSPYPHITVYEDQTVPVFKPWRSPYDWETDNLDDRVSHMDIYDRLPGRVVVEAHLVGRHRARNGRYVWEFDFPHGGAYRASRRVHELLRKAANYLAFECLQESNQSAKACMLRSFLQA